MKYFVTGILCIACIPYIVSAQVTGLSGWNIFLDPGHSQNENRGYMNYSEAKRNLRVALKLRDLLEASTDIDNVYMSRTNDQQYVTLSQRTDYANSVGAAWFHSLHSNAGSPESNNVLLLWGQYYNGIEKVPNGGKAMSDIILSILAPAMRIPALGSFGDCTFYSYSTFCQTSGGPYLHVNRETTMPSELSEAGYHTNPTQTQLFMCNDYHRIEARALYWSILQYHGISRPFAGVCVGIIRDDASGVPVNGALVTLNGETDTTDTYASIFYRYTNNPDLLHNGFYYFDDVPDGTLLMTVEADGYISDSSYVTVSPTFFTFHDVTLYPDIPPVLVSTSPAAGDSSYPAWNDIILEFSRGMQRTTTEAAFSLVPPAEGTFVWTTNDRKLIYDIDTLAFETDYLVSLSGSAMDTYGYFFDGDGDGIAGDGVTLPFRTSPPDIWPPRLVSIYPPQVAYGVELRPIINANYDEVIDPASISENIFFLERLYDHSRVRGTLRHYLVKDRTSICLFPEGYLRPDEVYISRIYPGFSDYFDNFVTAYQSSSFRTNVSDFLLTQIDDFESSILTSWWEPQQSGSTSGILTESTGREIDNEFVNLLSASSTSLALNYGWDTYATSWLIRLYLGGGPPKNVLFDKDYILQVYLFGDGSGNQFRFCVDDRYPNTAAANHEVSPWYTIDWLGWKLVSWDMANEGTGIWIGDGTLDGILRFDSIQLTYIPGSDITGTLYFDDLRASRYLPAHADDRSIVSPPSTFTLLPNHPNPFNPVTTVRYLVPAGLHRVRVHIYDILGNMVRTLVDERQAGGEYAVEWQATDDDGRSVASGVYLCTLLTPNGTQTIRLLLVR